MSGFLLRRLAAIGRRLRCWRVSGRPTRSSAIGAYAILTRDNPPLADYNERRWAEVAGYAREPFHELLRVYTLHRAELVNMLRQARARERPTGARVRKPSFRKRPPPQARLEDWQRVGAHELRGTITLLGEMTYLVEHKEEHCAQLEAMQ